MSNKLLRHTLQTAAVLFVASQTNLAFAHAQVGALGNAEASTDYYQVTCSDDGNGPPASLEVQVLDQTAGAAQLVSATVHKLNSASSTTDNTDNDANYSPFVWVNGNAGVYNVFVHKSTAGAENYTLQYHCQTAVNGGGAHTGTTLSTKQNQ